MNREEKACQGCDYIEAPVLDAGTKYFAENLQKKHQNEEDQLKQVESYKNAEPQDCESLE